MRIDPTTAVQRAARVTLDRPATMRDPSRAPIDVRVRDLSATGALLEAEAGLPIGTLVSLGLAGAGLQLARVVRETPGAMAIEFMLPLDAAAVSRAGHAETLVSVAFPQILVPSAHLSASREAETRAAQAAVSAPVPVEANGVAGQPFPARQAVVLAIVIAIALLIYLVA